MVEPKPEWASTGQPVTNRDLLKKFGEIVTHWSFGEAVIEDLIAGLLDANIVHVYTVTSFINISTRCKAIRALAALRMDPQVFGEFDSALEQFEGLVPFRNKLVHGLWSATGLPDTVTVSLVKSGNRLKHQTEFVNIAYLDWLDNQVTRATTLLFGFGSQHDLLGDVETGDENRPD